MTKRTTPMAGVVAIGSFFLLGCGATATGPDPLPEALSEPVPAPTVGLASLADSTAVLAGGCFWGVEAVFESVRGVLDVVSGYSGGTAATAHYPLVVGGVTDHAEVVRIRFDPGQISYAQILRIFFLVAHDPTQLDRQGPDIGREYRSNIFFLDDAQHNAAAEYMEELNGAGTFARPIVTRLDPLEAFYPAEEEHQDFVRKNPNDPYVVRHDLPLLAKLRQTFPNLYEP